MLHVVFVALLDNAKRAYYCAVNAVFGKVGRFASKKVVLQLVSEKCMPISLYGCEACDLRSSDVRSLDFTINRLLTKLFKTTNIHVIEDCVGFFNFELPSALLVKRQRNFQLKYYSCEIFFSSCSRKCSAADAYCIHLFFL